LATATIQGENETTKKAIPTGTRKKRTNRQTAGGDTANRSVNSRKATAKRLPAANAMRITSVVALRPVVCGST
jgi:hypothetical protein